MMLLVIILAVLLVSTAAIAGNVGAKNKNGPKVKLVLTGKTDSPLGNQLKNLALDDGLKVFDRSDRVIGVLKAEARLALAFGDKSEWHHAQHILDTVDDKAIGDIRIDLQENATSGMSTVNITVGNQSLILTFKTPDPKDTASQQLWARAILNTAMAMYNAQQGSGTG